MTAIYTMRGSDQQLEVFEDRLTITPNGLLGFMLKGLKGTKVIPYTSITAIQFKRSGITYGYIQFSISGGIENKFGLIEASTDENTVIFYNSIQNELVEEIKNYIEGQIKNIHSGSNSSSSNSADEIAKYFSLKEKGIITAEEFEIKKRQLLGIYENEIQEKSSTDSARVVKREEKRLDPWFLLDEYKR